MRSNIVQSAVADAARKLVNEIGCGSFEVKNYNETRRFLEDTAIFERVGVDTYGVFEPETRVNDLSP